MPDDAKPITGAAASTDAAVRVLGLDHVVLRVASLERAIDFYQRVLGCHVERELEQPRLVQLRAGNSMIDVVPKGEGEEPGRNMDHYAIRIEHMDVAAVSAHLKRNGIDPGEPRRRYGAEGYGLSIYITDPDGNTVELKGPPERA